MSKVLLMGDYCLLLLFITYGLLQVAGCREVIVYCYYLLLLFITYCLLQVAVVGGRWSVVGDR